MIYAVCINNDKDPLLELGQIYEVSGLELKGAPCASFAMADNVVIAYGEKSLLHSRSCFGIVDVGQTEMEILKIKVRQYMNEAAKVSWRTKTCARGTEVSYGIVRKTDKMEQIRHDSKAVIDWAYEALEKTMGSVNPENRIMLSKDYAFRQVAINIVDNWLKEGTIAASAAFLNLQKTLQNVEVF